MGASIKFSRTLMEVPIKLLGSLVVIFLMDASSTILRIL